MATDGSGWTWGKNDAGQLGNGNTMSPQMNPVLVSGLTGIGTGGVVSRSTVYSYDRLSRLTNVDAPGASEDTAYTYDPAGNRLSKTRGTTTSYSYDRADRITMAGAASYTVDANGNTTNRGYSDSFTYDRANRLKSVAVSGQMSNYTYNGDGVRVSKYLSGTTSTYVSDTNRSLPVVLDDGTRKYVWGLGLAYEVEGSNAFTYYTDGLGSVRAISDSTGTTAQTYRTDEFGLPMDTQGASAQPFRYTGEQRDSATGFVNLRARSYDPAVGRFMSWDPVDGFATAPLSLNPYSYVRNNPVNRVDPSGLTPVTPPRAGIKEDALRVGTNPVCAATTSLGQACEVSGGGGGDVVGPTIIFIGAAVIIITNAGATAFDQVSEWVGNTFFTERSGAQDRKLSPGEISKLKKAGIDPEALKQGIVGKQTGGIDLYKDRQGNVIVKPSGGKGPGEPTGVNINELP